MENIPLKNNTNNVFPPYERLQSLIFQIYLALLVKPKKVLEIGIGNEFVSSYLKKFCEVTTADIDQKLQPDIVLDISEEEDFKQVQNDYYDLIIICEVLEHIPFVKLDSVLNQLRKKTKKFVLISVPNESNALVMSYHRKGYIKKLYLPIILPIKLVTMIINRIYSSLSNLHYKFIRSKLKFAYDGQHHWQLGIDKYSVNLFREKLKAFFKIKYELRLNENLYHHFFLLEKNNKAV